MPESTFAENARLWHASGVLHKNAPYRGYHCADAPFNPRLPIFEPFGFRRRSKSKDKPLPLLLAEFQLHGYGLEQAGECVDGEGEDDGIEAEGEDAVDEGEGAEAL